jgi:glycosyltransferase involved in cell wall biosynthesis
MRLGIPTCGADGGRSGISSYLIEVLREFGSMAVEGEVLVYSDEKDIFLPNDPHSRLTSASIPTWVRSPMRNLVWTTLALPVIAARQRYDVLFLPAGNRRVPAWSPCPMVGTVHDLAAAHLNGKYDAARTFYVRRILPRLIERLDAVITVSTFSKNDILRFTSVEDSKVHVIPLACNHHQYYLRDAQECQERVRLAYGISDPYLLYISRIEHPGKNHIRLIEAFEQLKARHSLPHKLVLAGSDWDRASEVHERALRSPLVNDIVFTGFAATDMIPYLYGGCDVMVFPSLFEGFGLPILEAMACGAPVLCSNRASMPEVAGDAAPLFEPDQVDSIVAALEAVVPFHSEKERLRAAGLARAGEFSWQRTAAQTLKILSDVAKT